MKKQKTYVGADASVRPHNKGITLIALIITIIVMLILVAVTINMAVNGGLFDYARQAKMKQEIAQYSEALEQARVEAEMKTYIENVNLLSAARTIVGNYTLFANATIGEIINNQFTVITEEGYEFLVAENGIQYVGINLNNGNNNSGEQIGQKVTLTLMFLQGSENGPEIQQGANEILQVDKGETVEIESKSFDGYVVSKLITIGEDSNTHEELRTETNLPGTTGIDLSFELNDDSTIIFIYTTGTEQQEAPVSNPSGSGTQNASTEPTTATNGSGENVPLAKSKPSETEKSQWDSETGNTDNDTHKYENIQPVGTNQNLTITCDVSDIAIPGDTIEVKHRKIVANTPTWENLGDYVVDNNNKISFEVSSFSPFSFKNLGGSVLSEETTVPAGSIFMRSTTGKVYYSTQPSAPMIRVIDGLIEEWAPQYTEQGLGYNDIFEYDGNIMPDSFEWGDAYIDGDYAYSWFDNGDGRRGVIVVAWDKYKDSYGQILNKICDAPVQAMYKTYENCINLTTVGTIPNSILVMVNTFSGCTSLTTSPSIPQSVTNLAETFSGCTSLTTAPHIYRNVIEVTRAFKDCTSLTGNIWINANPQYLSGCFDGTRQSITLRGSSNKLDVLAATSSAGNVQVGN